jgi:hypothetical protein
MIPITPPTDSLYKLMALFGLGLFVLGIINYNTFSDDIVRAELEIEKLQDSIANTIYSHGAMTPEFEQNIREEELSSMNAKELASSLESLESFIFSQENIPGNEKSTMSTQIDMIQIKYNFQHSQKTLNYLVIIAASVLMFLGFFLWYIKDQRWKDLQLKNEALNSSS